MRNLSVLACLFAFVVIGCAADHLPNDPRNIASADARVEPSTNVLHYGNGVYYFDVSGAQFGNALARFIAEHPDRSIQTAMPYTCASGNTHGYFVVTIPAPTQQASKQ